MSQDDRSWCRVARINRAGATRSRVAIALLEQYDDDESIEFQDERVVD